MQDEKEPDHTDIDKKLSDAILAIGWDKKKETEFIQGIYQKKNIQKLDYYEKESLVKSINQLIDEQVAKDEK